jgi:hypothetical protein
VVIGGGGYVNTELRDLKAGFDAFDYFVFDRGYGALAALLDRLEAEESGAVYKTLCQSRRDGRFIKGPGIDGPAEDQALAPYAALDREGARTVFPDYQGVDFSRYLYPLDDANPMHRLWSDGHWLKAYLAHGCYWRGCAFCDTALDYIRAFEPVDPASLFNHLKAQAEQTGVRAVHLVDEAVPPASLIRFAELNRAAGLPLIFWGNIRFDRAFNPDAAALLAAGGLIGVSGGIEVASPQGFKRLGKGIDLADAVRVCAAFKEQGVLTHAYLIYGYWDESPQELIDSVETLRQLFAAGLLDSAFWHKFVLTRHSRLYAEWRRGLHPGLRVLDSSPAGLPASFAPNDLRFAGEEGFDRYTGPLDRLLAAWMAGDTTGTDRSNPAAWAFPFPLPRPQTPPDLVIQLLDKYARERDCFRAKPPAENQGRVLFLGGRPVLSRNAGGSRLAWRWHGEERRLCLAGGAALEQGRALAALLEQAGRSSAGALGFYEELRRLLGAAADDSWRRLRTQGLIYREQIVDSVCP